MAGETTTNAELAAEVVGAVAAVRGAQDTVEQAATLLASHLGDPKAHGAETKVNILAAVPKPVWDGKNLGFKNDDNSLSFPAVDLSGPIGPKGEPGLTPGHQWDGTKLKLQNPDGTWPAVGTDLKSDSTVEAQEAATVATGAAERAESSELSVAANADVASQKATMASTAADTATSKAQEASTSAAAAATSATAAATSAQNAAKSAADSATNATLTAASVDAVTVQAGKAKTQADRAQTEADRAAAVAIPAQEGVTGMVVPGRGLGITTPGTLDLDVAGETALGGVQIATAADVEAGMAGEVPKVLAVGSDALNALMPTMLIGSIQTLLWADGCVPNGCVPANGGEYTRAQFPNLYDAYLVGGKLLTCTYEQQAAQVGLTGNCAKFALDTINQKFKVPLLKDGDSITQAASAAELGKSIKAGVPNATGVIGDIWDANMATGICAKGNTLNNLSASNGSVVYAPVTIDLSRASSVYRNDVTTVLDEQIRLRHFVVVASAQNSSSVFDWSNYMEALAGKANSDLGNIDLNKVNIVLQRVAYETGSMTSTTSVIPCDDTVPQITEGAQVMSVSITPKRANSKIEIDVTMYVTCYNATSHMVAAVFKDSESNAIAAGIATNGGVGFFVPLRLKKIIQFSDGNPHTISVRMGVPNTSYPVSLNGTSSRLFGGSLVSSLVVTEYAA